MNVYLHCIVKEEPTIRVSLSAVKITGKQLCIEELS